VTISLDDINLLEDTWAQAVPYDQFELLRSEAPVYWHEHPDYQGFWAVTRYDDVRAVSRDHTTFSAELGSTFLADMDEASMELVRMTILNMDPPKHSRFRRLVSAGFKPRMINALVDHINELAQGIVKEIEGEDEIEFVERVAAELPLQVICELLGVPAADRHRFAAWSAAMIDDVSAEEAEQARLRLSGYLAELVARKRVEPDGALLSALVEVADEGGDRLSQVELVAMGMLLLIAGHETTTNLIGNALVALLTHPDQLALLREHPGCSRGRSRSSCASTPRCGTRRCGWRWRTSSTAASRSRRAHSSS
jgi:cholest-4-en-3-one 26-monooxygenase